MLVLSAATLMACGGDDGDAAASEAPVACAQGQTNCSGACVSTVTDASNCGVCGQACPAGQSCSNGACTTVPQTCGVRETNCSGACVVTSEDPDNCGACGNVCDADQVCATGSCMTVCGHGQTNCGGACVNTGTDVNNCGSCGNACSSVQSCINGSCSSVPVVCTSGQTNCNGTCVVTATDTSNCGACGNVCTAGQVCASGSCAPVCGPGQTNCAGVCVSTAGDNNNCGSCGNVCPGGQTCTGGTCVAPSYDVTIWAWDPLGWQSELVYVDSFWTGFSTPRTWTGLTGVHTFTLPGTDANGFKFSGWSTGETSPTITISSGGTHTARYELYDVTIWASTPAGWASVPFVIDGWAVVSTPYTFTDVSGPHTLTAPATFNAYVFSSWDTGETSRTLTVSAPGTHTARYGP